MAAFGLPELASLNDPQIAVDQAALQRQMALAQLLRQQAMTPLDISNRQIGGMGYKVSPLEGIAKVLQGYKASQMEKSTDESRLALSQRMMQGLSGMFGDQGQQGTQAPAPVSDAGALPAGVSSDQMAAGGFPQPPQGQAPQQVAPPGRKQLGLAAMMRMGLANDIGGPEAAKIIGQDYSTPDKIRELDLTGQDRAEVGKATLGKLRKEANAPTRLGNGAYADNAGNIMGLPQAIPGSINIPAPGVPGGWQTVPVPGAAPAITRESGAKSQGALYGQVLRNGVDAQGNPQPIQTEASALGLPPLDAQVPPAVQAQRDDGRKAILRAELTNTTDPKDRALLQKELDATQGGTATIPKSGVYGAPPLGTAQAQDELSKSWSTLKTASGEAQNTKSYLQNILTAAEKGAIVGPAADKREFVNGLLSLVPGAEKATNAQTQTDLLEKYSNQIVARLGGGSMGTDAARAILTSAYPGQHMNIQAIREAVSNLSGAQDMTQAKARYLIDSGTKRDTTTYQKRELEFDQNADPRIWQYKSIRDPAAKKAFAKEVLQQDPSFPDRIRKLEDLGAL